MNSRNVTILCTLMACTEDYFFSQRHSYLVEWNEEVPADCETLPRNTNRFVRVTCTTDPYYHRTGVQLQKLIHSSAYSRNACLVLRDRGSRWRRSKRKGYLRTRRCAYNLETTRFENLIQAEPNIRNFLRFERTRKICNEEEGLVSKGVKEKSFRQRR